MCKHLPAIAVGLAVLGAACAAGAQEVAGTFDQLRVLLKPGDKVTVIDGEGKEATGRVAELTSSSLALMVAEQRRDLQPDEVATIRQRRSDSLANGARWGFGVGAALGLLGGLAVADEYDGASGAFVAFATLLYGGFGAGIGVGIDAMIETDQVIYSRRNGSSARFGIQPLLTGRRRGAALTVRF